jgi:hypothetical protein
MLINELFLGLNYPVKHFVILITAIFFSVNLLAQDDVIEITHGAPVSFKNIKIQPVNIRASCTVPKITSSEAFRISFSGFYDAQLSVNFRTLRKFSVGFGYKSALFGPQLYFRQKGLSTRLQVHDGFLRFGYDHILGDKGFLSLSVDGGATYNKYTSVKFSQDSLNGKYPTSYVGGFIRPELSINFMVEDNFAFGFTFAYNYCLFNYDPIYNGFGSYADSKSSKGNIIYEGTGYKNRASMGWFSFGFGFYYGFKRKTAG